MNRLSLETGLFQIWSPSKSSKQTRSPTQIISPTHDHDDVNCQHDDMIEYYETSIFDFKVNNVNDQEVCLSQYKGKKLYLIVNASSFGSNAIADENYSQLQTLYAKYHDDLEILMFLSDDFTGPSGFSSNQIARAARIRGINYPIFSKIHVDSEHYADEIHPLFNFLTSSSSLYRHDHHIDHHHHHDGPIEWNFAKFLCDDDGNVIHRYAPYRAPITLEHDIVSFMMMPRQSLPDVYKMILQDNDNTTMMMMGHDDTGNHHRDDAEDHVNHPVTHCHHVSHHRQKSKSSSLSSMMKSAAALFAQTTRRLSSISLISSGRRASLGLPHMKPVKATRLSPKKVHVIG